MTEAAEADDLVKMSEATPIVENPSLIDGITEEPRPIVALPLEL
jgi:hypothetical protein